jgi:hypothetical protein
MGSTKCTGILIKRNKANKNQFFQIKISKYLSSKRRDTVLVKSILQIHSGSYLLQVLYRIRTPEFVIYKIGVADPDPSDLYVFWAPGSGYVSQRYRSGAYHQAKIVSKTLIPILYDFFIFEK